LRSDKGRRSRKVRRALAYSHFHFGLSDFLALKGLNSLCIFTYYLFYLVPQLLLAVDWKQSQQKIDLSRDSSTHTTHTTESQASVKLISNKSTWCIKENAVWNTL